jgi:hypothetical protein
MGNFLAVIFGAIVSMGIAILIEYLRRPNLDLGIDPPVNISHLNMRSLRVRLSNKALPGWAKWTLRAPALQCRAAITFHSPDNKQDIFGRAMEGRWTETPEPLRLEPATPEGQPIVMMPPWRGVVVYPGESEVLDIAIRVDGDDNCYGWNDESYTCTPFGRNPNWKLPQGRYLVQVVVTSSGQKCDRWCSLINSASSLTAFRLEAPPS